ncbi:RNA polymerase sigma factor [Nonomuraea rubra]
MPDDDRAFSYHDQLTGTTSDHPATTLRSQFLKLFDGEHRKVVGAVMRCGASLPEAEDAAQEAFMALWKQLKKQQNGTERISKVPEWLRTVAVKAYWRSLQPAITAVAEVPAPHTAVDDHQDLAARTIDVMTALRELDPDTRMILALSMEGFTAVELAAQLEHLSAQQVRDKRKRGRRHLARRLGLTSRRRAD